MALSNKLVVFATLAACFQAGAVSISELPSTDANAQAGNSQRPLTTLPSPNSEPNDSWKISEEHWASMDMTQGTVTSIDWVIGRIDIDDNSYHLSPNIKIWGIPPNVPPRTRDRVKFTLKENGIISNLAVYPR